MQNKKEISRLTSTGDVVVLILAACADRFIVNLELLWKPGKAIAFGGSKAIDFRDGSGGFLYNGFVNGIVSTSANCSLQSQTGRNISRSCNRIFFVLFPLV